jgi:hypothetical protein
MLFLCKADIFMTLDVDDEWMRKKLTELYDEHRRLDDIINHITREATVDYVQMQRLKKHKLSLRDQIHKIESELLPDIIA